MSVETLLALCTYTWECRERFTSIGVVLDLDFSSRFYILQYNATSVFLKYYYYINLCLN